jgi:hypothetical protein
LIVKTMSQDSEGFWQLMGRFFADRCVRKELGMAMSSDERYTWFVAIDGNTVLGFCAAVATPGGIDYHKRLGIGLSIVISYYQHYSVIEFDSGVVQVYRNVLFEVE